MIVGKMPHENRAIAEQALTWLFHSERRMNVEELAVAAVFDLDVGLHSTRLVVPTDILHICGAFVEQDPATHVVRLAHASVREYLRSKAYARPEIAVPLLLKICLLYLQSPHLTRIPYQTLQGKRELECDEFFTFAALSWPAYAQSASDSASLDLVSHFLTDPTCEDNFRLWSTFWSYVDFEETFRHSARTLAYHLTYQPSTTYSWQLSTTFETHPICTPLYVAVRIMSGPLVQRLLNCGQDPNVEGGYLAYPLHAAVWLECEDLVRDLLGGGANPNAEDWFYKTTPLHKAARSGHTNIVKILVGYGANIAAVGNAYARETPLSSALESSKEPDSEIIELLLAPAPRENAIQALEYVVFKNWCRTAQILLQSGIGDALVARDRHGNTRLHRAAELCSIEMIHMLLQSGADFTQTNEWGWRPVHSAIRKGKLGVARLLPGLPKITGGDVRVLVDGNDITTKLFSFSSQTDVIQLCCRCLEGIQRYPADAPADYSEWIFLSILADYCFEAGETTLSAIFRGHSVYLNPKNLRVATALEVTLGQPCDRCHKEIYGRIWSCRNCYASYCSECHKKTRDHRCGSDQRHESRDVSSDVSSSSASYAGFPVSGHHLIKETVNFPPGKWSELFLHRDRYYLLDNPAVGRRRSDSERSLSPRRSDRVRLMNRSMVARTWDLELTASEHRSITHSEAGKNLLTLQIIVNS